MKTDIGISEGNRRAVGALLNALLSDEYVLYTKTRNYHWNVTGPQFSELHQFFESQYSALDEIVDEVAERARAVGERAYGSLAQFSRHTRLKEAAERAVKAEKMLTDLLSDHETVIQILRGDLETCMNKHGDAGTSDFLTGLMEKHEKMAWMLRSFLEA